MDKLIPDPPQNEDVSPYANRNSKKFHKAAKRALDHYLGSPSNSADGSKHTPSKIFIVAPDLDNETLLVHACETLASVNVLASDLAFDLDGSTRHAALAVQQMVSLGELLVNRVLDNLETSAAAT